MYLDAENGRNLQHRSNLTNLHGDQPEQPEPPTGSHTTLTSLRRKNQCHDQDHDTATTTNDQDENQNNENKLLQQFLHKSQTRVLSILYVFVVFKTVNLTALRCPD
jgi:hypothetical protein